MIRLVDYNETFLDLSWKWLNDPEIKSLTNTPDFTRADQWNWFTSLKNKHDYLIFGILYEEKPIGACGLKNISNGSAEYWGYIGEKDYWGRGIGKLILDEVIRVAKDLGVKRVWLRVVKNNTRAIKLYERVGFVKFDESNVELFMERKLF